MISAEQNISSWLSHILALQLSPCSMRIIQKAHTQPVATPAQATITPLSTMPQSFAHIPEATEIVPMYPCRVKLEGRWLPYDTGGLHLYGLLYALVARGAPDRSAVKGDEFTCSCLELPFDQSHPQMTRLLAVLVGWPLIRHHLRALSILSWRCCTAANWKEAATSATPCGPKPETPPRA